MPNSRGIRLVADSPFAFYNGSPSVPRRLRARRAWRGGNSFACRGAVMQELPIGVDNFAVLRQKDWLYVDKTQRLAEMADRYDWVFLARPGALAKPWQCPRWKPCFPADRAFSGAGRRGLGGDAKRKAKARASSEHGLSAFLGDGAGFERCAGVAPARESKSAWRASAERKACQHDAEQCHAEHLQLVRKYCCTNR